MLSETLMERGAVVHVLDPFAAIARPAQGLDVRDEVRTASHDRDNVVARERSVLEATGAAVVEGCAQIAPFLGRMVAAIAGFASAALVESSKVGVAVAKVVAALSGQAQRGSGPATVSFSVQLGMGQPIGFGLFSDLNNVVLPVAAVDAEQPRFPLWTLAALSVTGAHLVGVLGSPGAVVGIDALGVRLLPGLLAGFAVDGQAIRAALVSKEDVGSARCATSGTGAKQLSHGSLMRNNHHHYTAQAFYSQGV